MVVNFHCLSDFYYFKQCVSMCKLSLFVDSNSDCALFLDGANQIVGLSVSDRYCFCLIDFEIVNQTCEKMIKISFSDLIDFIKDFNIDEIYS